MSRLRSRINRIERHAGPPGTCPACRGTPVGGIVMVEQDAAGREVGRSAPGRCRVCGEYGPSTLIVIKGEPPAR